jgi:WD40 repeat protein
LLSKDGNEYNSAKFDKSLISGNCFLPQGHSNTVESVVFHPDGKTFISGGDDNTIKAWNLLSGESLATIINVPGLLVAGCSFINLHPKSQLSEEAMNIMLQYGAIFDENDEKRWNEAVNRAFS